MMRQNALRIVLYFLLFTILAKITKFANRVGLDWQRWSCQLVRNRSPYDWLRWQEIKAKRRK
jgi:hypothetical protein